MRRYVIDAEANGLVPVERLVATVVLYDPAHRDPVTNQTVPTNHEVLLDGTGTVLSLKDGGDVPDEVRFRATNGSATVKAEDGRRIAWAVDFSDAEKDDQGRFLINPVAVVQKVLGSAFTRYNGGWTKRIDKLDKSKTNGYSLVGDFANSRIEWTAPGLLLDCGIGGSRKNQSKVYHLVRFYASGHAALAGSIGDDRSWAVKLWPDVERELAEIAEERAPKPEATPEPENPLAVISEDDLLAELRRRGYADPLEKQPDPPAIAPRRRARKQLV